MKSKTGAAGGSSSRAAFELKQRVIQSLNKLSDRDTHGMGVEELERMAAGEESIISPFLSCITDPSSSDHPKPAVRRECVRLIGILARTHPAPHHLLLNKMVSGIVRRLKDTDSSVRDACVDTSGVLAAAVSSSGTEAAFAAIAKQLFEALMGEQNRYVQMGSALCLARVVDEYSRPPASFLPQMLTRVVKLLKNPNFIAKPAVIELIRSIVQAGGASTEHALSTAVTGIMETLKSTDWTTRKAASAALAAIALCARPLLGSLKTSCICSLESCRFDKVKPVRDTVLHALHCWKTLPGTGSPEPSDAGSSAKENMNRDYADVTSASDGGWREISRRNGGPLSPLSGISANTSGKRYPSTVRKTCPNHVQNHNRSSPNDWHVEISLPKVNSMSSVNNHRKEFAPNCTAMTFEGDADESKVQGAKYGYDATEDNVGCSSMSDIVSGCFETKHVTVDEGNAATLVGIAHRSAPEEVELVGLRTQERKSLDSTVTDLSSQGLRTQERKSLDSTVTDLSSQGMHECCLHAASELTFIRKQLLDIENKQSNLLDLLQAFMGNSEDNLSTLQLKVHNLEHAVNNIVKNISHCGSHANMTNSKSMKSNHSVSSSPRLSTSTPRPSVESNHRQPSLSTLNSNEVWGVHTSSRTRSSTSVKEGAKLWRDPTLKIVRNHVLRKDSGISSQNTTNSGAKGTRDIFSVPAHNVIATQGKIKSKNGIWKHIKEFLQVGDIESAYAEALYGGDELCLIELMNRTGPVLERLSCELTGIIISILATQFLNQRFMDSIIPWILQVVDLCSASETRQLIMSSKSRLEFLYALREAAAMECLDTVDRIAIAEFAEHLSQLWGEASSRKMLAARGS